jgi:hypothetical protein
MPDAEILFNKAVVIDPVSCGDGIVSSEFNENCEKYGIRENVNCGVNCLAQNPTN